MRLGCGRSPFEPRSNSDRTAVLSKRMASPSRRSPEPERDPELAEAVKKLPPRRRLIVFLRYFADLSYDEIADICGISEGTVGAALAHARSALAEQLATERGER